MSRSVSRILSFVGSTDRHLLLAPLNLLARASGSGGIRLMSTRFPVRHYGADDPGHLVDQSHRCHLTRLPAALKEAVAELWRLRSPGPENQFSSAEFLRLKNATQTLC